MLSRKINYGIVLFVLISWYLLTATICGRFSFKYGFDSNSGEDVMFSRTSISHRYISSKNQEINVSVYRNKGGKVKKIINNYNKFTHIALLNKTFGISFENQLRADDTYLREYDFHYCPLHKMMSTIMQVIGDLLSL